MSAVTIKSRSKSLKDVSIDLNSKPTLDSVLQEISKQNKNISKYRIRLTYLKESKQVPITSEKFFQEENTPSNEQIELFIKDLGPQISWRLVFAIEYLGPILVHTFFYKLSQNPDVIAKWHHDPDNYMPGLNQLAYYMILAHYLKREFETLFIHKFSLATMPLFNLFKNSFHYWVLNGMIVLGYFGYGFLFNDDILFKVYNTTYLNNIGLLIGLFVISEFWNFIVHLKLRRWGDKQKELGNANKRVPINEGLFTMFVAPNYTFEVWSWIWFTLVFKINLFALIFLVVSATQMYLWAQKKNRKYGTRRAFFIPYLF
ncbi:hypothetical protein KAFR_0F02320 [Kazachstania africana CBS 2517]|uniref:3-oxo-5-alpha-steroid 4-dehydrogenase C-terminal domain-containing protein n=1 Tax=Kazachstania africana (strain ATCC 22294 / BCRC 22015 / CBS 2517 / CECT 1963 / NBRC 1671 / NRRL Y-8276) TaxID=1071382 RepID=H2AWS9_KAZAF|nr:hypothetical protein KAFR_0F02320 [Kazachstania africana CBS 2517]CCF58829.1 hypothetical protein KAFR_0F02320 [Kazachstania africana CBS 2517]